MGRQRAKRGHRGRKEDVGEEQRTFDSLLEDELQEGKMCTQSSLNTERGVSTEEVH